MNQFYVSIIFSGILVIITALVLIAADYKKSLSGKDNDALLKDELSKVVDDAEQMMEELNKLSEHIVETMEAKGQELADIIKTIDLKVQQYNAEQYKLEGQEAAAGCTGEQHDECAAENLLNESTVQYTVEDDEQTAAAKAFLEETIKERMAKMSSRHKEVVKLAEMGLSDVEIARRLNIGKGEIALILDVNR